MATTTLKPERQAEHYHIPSGAWTRGGPVTLDVTVTAFDGRVERAAFPSDRLTFRAAKALPAMIAKIERGEQATEPQALAAKSLPTWGKQRVRYTLPAGAYVGGAHKRGGSRELLVSIHLGPGSDAHISLGHKVITRRGALYLAALVARIEAGA